MDFETFALHCKGGYEPLKFALTPLHYMNYSKLINRYKHLRSIYFSDNENKVILSDKEFKAMLIQLKRSIIVRKYQESDSEKIFKREFPEE